MAVTSPSLQAPPVAPQGQGEARPVRVMAERQALLLPHLTQADRVAVFRVNKRRGGAFQIVDTPQGTRLEAGPYVGVFALATFTVQVVPKAEIGTRNTLFMLARTQGRDWALPPAHLNLDSTDLQDELAALLLATLRPELHRGLLRRSQTVQEDLPVLRGRLRVAAYLRRGDPSRLPVEYADLTTNHPVNRLFLLVLERLAARVSTPRLRQQVAELRGWLQGAGVTSWPSVPRDREAFTLNRLQRRYQPALNLVWLLLEGWGAFQEAGEWRGQAFTFNMDRLYERFLERVLVEEVLQGTGYVGHPQRPGAAGEYLFSGNVQQLKPDLTITQGGQVRLIVDFKNKRPEGQPGGGDLYQMYAYARHLGCDRVLLLYPGEVGFGPLEATRAPPLRISAAGLDLKPDLRTHREQLHQQLRAHLQTQGLHL
ncbi:McrC family protein [Deinococcus aestuarii]|uniref:McrC family protein n=1 Tax=Deinococcus aestuarii TaxID=2774531 RepID=UPI001C0B5776|nr:McrC family protein [Deinococcus aestuarii]